MINDKLLMKKNVLTKPNNFVTVKNRVDLESEKIFLVLGLI
jgi:hypothetical protein